MRAFFPSRTDRELFTNFTEVRFVTTTDSPPTIMNSLASALSGDRWGYPYSFCPESKFKNQLALKESESGIAQLLSPGEVVRTAGNCENLERDT